MFMFSRRIVAGLAVALLVVGCSGSPSGPGDQGATPQVTAPTVEPESTPAATSDPEQMNWPTPGPSVSSVRGEAGGALTIDGKQIGRGTSGDFGFLTKSLGEPEDTRVGATCYDDPLPHKRYRWGALNVIILDAEPDFEYGFSYPAGSVAGWVIDPATGEPWSGVKLTGPEGISLGASLSTLKKTFENGEWDYAGVDTVAGKPTYSIFVGDTTGAAFVLDGSQKVAAMKAGFTCGA